MSQTVRLCIYDITRYIKDLPLDEVIEFGYETVIDLAVDYEQPEYLIHLISMINLLDGFLDGDHVLDMHLDLILLHL